MPPDDTAAARPAPSGEAPPPAAAWRRLWPLGLLALAAAAAYLTGAHRWLSFESLAAHRAAGGAVVAATHLPLPLPGASELRL